MICKTNMYKYLQYNEEFSRINVLDNNILHCINKYIILLLINHLIIFQY